MQQWAKSFVISQKFDFYDYHFLYDYISYYNDDLDFEKHNINTQKFKNETMLKDTKESKKIYLSERRTWFVGNTARS